MEIKNQQSIRTMRLKVKAEGYAWLNAAAIEVNQLWNFANATSYKAAQPFAGKPKWLTAFDLDKLTAGASKCFDRIGSETIQRVNAEFATRRKQFNRARLKWRVSRGSRRSLGWIPYKAAQLKRRCGCFAQDSVGDWWLCLPVAVEASQRVAPKKEVGIDLGLEHIATTSDGEKLFARHFYRNIEKKIAAAQRRGHKRQAKRLHRTAARRRKEALHRFSTKLVKEYQNIVVGDVSSRKLVKTRMAKSVLDAGWGILKAQLQYKDQHAGRCVSIVSERDTTRTCNDCKALTGPTGIDMLVVRTRV
jgi:putative transposase